MKKILLMLMAAAMPFAAGATLKTYHLEKGETLFSKIGYADMPTLDSLKVTGTMQQSDLYPKSVIRT